MISEPLGGAHRNVHDTVYNVEQFILKSLAELKRVKTDALMERRYQKIRSFGANCIELQAKAVHEMTIPDKLSAKAQIQQAEEIPSETNL